MSQNLKTDIDSKVSNILDDICNLSVMQLHQLSEAFKEKFNLPDMGAMSFGGGSGAQAAVANEVEEKTSFEVVLKSAGANKVAVIKVVKEMLNCGLIDAKKIVETANAVLKKDVSKKEAEDAKLKVEEAGGEVELK
uniref:50S ribosomal protein L7/L12 n=1 Tax=Biomphalaria glabrata TaxID=6526 RepID=A0A2C9KTZ5_BIOGL